MDPRRAVLGVVVAGSVACSLTLSVDLERQRASAATPPAATVSTLVAAYRADLETLCARGTLTREQCTAQRVALDDLDDPAGAGPALARLDLENAHIPTDARARFVALLRAIRRAARP